MQKIGGAEAARAERRAIVSMRIELATLRLCLKQGIENVTVEEVAGASGISRRTFYRYFETIYDVLGAMPRRSLRRISEDYRNRPASEGVVEAFIQVARNTRRSDEELAIQGLGIQVAQRSHEAWWRAMNLVQPSAHDIYTDLIAERLRLQSQDPASAGLISSVLLSVLHYVAQQNIRKANNFPNPDVLEGAVRTLALIMKDAVSD